MEASFRIEQPRSAGMGARELDDGLDPFASRAREKGAAAIAAAVSDTLKRADVDLAVSDSVDREQLYAMQTPQIFERKLLEDAYRKVFDEKMAVTDEVSAVERNGGKVTLVLNEQPNFKITYAGDLQLAELVLRQRLNS